MRHRQVGDAAHVTGSLRCHGPGSQALGIPRRLSGSGFNLVVRRSALDGLRLIDDKSNRLLDGSIEHRLGIITRPTAAVPCQPAEYRAPQKPITKAFDEPLNVPEV